MYSINYIRNFNPELHKISDDIIEKHINIHKKNLITNEYDFNKLYSDFNVVYYKYFNEDLYKFNNVELKIHYHNYGKNENRIYHKNIFFKIYKNFNKDVKNFKKKEFIDLIFHLKKKYNLDEEVILFKIYEITHKLNKDIKTILHYKISLEIKELHKLNISKNFDYEFYKNVYRDLEKSGLNTFEDYYSHYINYGKKEGRKCNLRSMVNFYDKSLLLDNYKISDKVINKKENLINILIRNCYRPNYFSKCIESILKQNYKNYRIIICYDDKKCNEYLNKYLHKNIEKFYINLKNKNKYKFNLYCNHLLNRVKEGWILFLDDDDKLVNNNCLKIINNKITCKNDFLIWNFLRPDKIIKIKDINNIQLGDIDTTSFLFNKAYKDLVRWDDQQNGDFRFVKNILNKNNFNVKIINKILTSTIYKNKVANYGE